MKYCTPEKCELVTKIKDVKINLEKESGSAYEIKLMNDVSLCGGCIKKKIEINKEWRDSIDVSWNV